jgi:hypothetical protein
VTQIKPAKKNRGQTPQEEIKKRQLKLKDIIYEASLDGKFLTQKEVLEKLKEAGYKISRSELTRDKRAIATQNDFIRDLAEHNYSQFMEESFNLYTAIREEALALAGSSWVKRTVKDKTTDEGGSHEVVNVTDEAGPKKMFYELALNAENSRVQMLKGDVLNYSVAYLGKKLDQYKAIIDSRSKTKGVFKLK